MCPRFPADASQTTCDLERVREVIMRESAALQSMAAKLDEQTNLAIDELAACRGRVIVTGMGKAGLIGKKAVATFCSTGTPASFLHPAEAIHGDLGVVSADDVLVVLSNSGETEEPITLLPFMRRLGVTVLALTGNTNSTLARGADVIVNVGVEFEADSIAPAPTCSTTAMLAMCDALAVALMYRRGFTAEQFAIFHPGGHLGRKLLLRVADLMHQGEDVPCVAPTASLRDAVMVMSSKKLGTTCVTGASNELLGLFTDGDLRRVFERHENPLNLKINEVMTSSPHAIVAEALAAEALKLMEDHSISLLPVVDDSHRLVGVIHLHALVQSGLA